MNIVLPDGSTKELADGATVADVAASIGAGLVKAALAGIVNGQAVDLDAPVAEGDSVAIVTAKSDEGHGIAVGDDGVQVDGGVVDDAGQRRAGEPRADGGGHVGDGGALFQLLDGSVGQYDVHGTPFLAPGAHRAPARFPPGR